MNSTLLPARGVVVGRETPSRDEVAVALRADRGEILLGVAHTEPPCPDCGKPVAMSLRLIVPLSIEEAVALAEHLKIAAQDLCEMSRFARR